MPVEIKLTGTPADVDRLVERIRVIARVMGVSGDFPIMPAKRLVRRYLRVELIEKPDQPPKELDG